MSRKIEFRAYYKPLKKYLPISSISFKLGAVKGSDPLEIVNLEGASYFTLYGVERPNVATPVAPESVVIEQFTGLSDKNGKMIFEGDVLAAKYDEEIVRAVEVYWEPGIPGFDYHLIKGSPDNVFSWLEEYEVVGNIHEKSGIARR